MHLREAVRAEVRPSGCKTGIPETASEARRSERARTGSGGRRNPKLSCLRPPRGSSPGSPRAQEPGPKLRYPRDRQRNSPSGGRSKITETTPRLAGSRPTQSRPKVLCRAPSARAVIFDSCLLPFDLFLALPQLEALPARRNHRFQAIALTDGLRQGRRLNGLAVHQEQLLQVRRHRLHPGQ